MFKAGRKYHIQMSMIFVRSLAENRWKDLQPFISIKTKSQALKAIDAMIDAGYKSMPCSCKKIKKDGTCLGFA